MGPWHPDTMPLPPSAASCKKRSPGTVQVAGLPGVKDFVAASHTHIRDSGRQDSVVRWSLETLRFWKDTG